MLLLLHSNSHFIIHTSSDATKESNNSMDMENFNMRKFGMRVNYTVPVPSVNNRRSPSSQHQSSSSSWKQKRVFDADEHEVPSGPNPIANR
ncbi:hypothetical protein FRX31_002852 [Thalictrum thalictroides]|uniref:Uncharacterized protein n=1 Tax=Thalictrum thalictroides TaxID=46969 RepID=A0A7J6XDK6_THATH|nr:hypothetical protein FRX31_002852 [Thalictrum thalictroides]